MSEEQNNDASAAGPPPSHAGNRSDPPRPSDPPMSPHDELELTRAVVAGDPSALEQFHQRYSEPVYRFVFYRLGGHVPDVEEVVQDTFLAALEGLHRFRGRSALYTWLCAIAKNHISRLRRHRSRERLANLLEVTDPGIQAMIARLEEGELPDSVLEREETEDLVGATLASLPLTYQHVLLDKYVDAMPVNEIARRRGSTPKAIESTLTRARTAFRHAFGLLSRGMGGGRGPHLGGEANYVR